MATMSGRPKIASTRCSRGRRGTQEARRHHLRPRKEHANYCALHRCGGICCRPTTKNRAVCSRRLCLQHAWRVDEDRLLIFSRPDHPQAYGYSTKWSQEYVTEMVALVYRWRLEDLPDPAERGMRRARSVFGTPVSATAGWLLEDDGPPVAHTRKFVVAQYVVRDMVHLLRRQTAKYRTHADCAVSA